MPAISRFYGLVIAMYFNDHEPAHFHAQHGELEAKVAIAALEAIESTLSARDLRLVLAWAELHQQELAEDWVRARAGDTLNAIEPLR